MSVIRTFVPNSYANYNHLVYCPETKRAAAVDPFDADHLLEIAQQHTLVIEQIWITHEHGDHIRELEKLKALTNAQIFAPVSCEGKFQADYWLTDDHRITIGKTELCHYLTPGHTPGHGVYVFEGNENAKPYIVCGDTLFNAGVGNVNSGDVNVLYRTVERLNEALSGKTKLYPGHDYLETNLKFVLKHFPDAVAAKQKLAEIEGLNGDDRPLQTLNDERLYNPFLATDAPWVAEHPSMAAKDSHQRFVALRELRDQW